MFELLTGTGLAASSGLNAYIPLLTLGLLARFTDTVSLPAGWQWLDSGWALVILAGLLAIEMVARIDSRYGTEISVQELARMTDLRSVQDVVLHHLNGG